MYFWNLKALIEELKAGSVSQKSQFGYVIFTTLMVVLATIPYYVPPQVETQWDWLFLIVEILIPVLGTYIAYRVNVAGDNRDFILRYTCLSVPVMVRIILPYMVIMIFLDEQGAHQVLLNTLVSVFVTIIFAYEIWAINKVASSTGHQDDSREPLQVNPTLRELANTKSKFSLGRLFIAFLVLVFVVIVVFGYRDDAAQKELLLKAEEHLVHKQYDRAFNTAQQFIDRYELNERGLAKALLFQAVVYVADGNEKLARDRIKRALHFNIDVNYRSQLPKFNELLIDMRSQ